MTFPSGSPADRVDGKTALSQLVAEAQAWDHLHWPAVEGRTSNWKRVPDDQVLRLLASWLDAEEALVTRARIELRQYRDLAASAVSGD